jgi:sulfur carrier protein
MTVVLNGKNVDISEGMTLLELLESRKISPETVVVELNRELLSADAFASTILGSGDLLEVLRFVGGG